MLPGTALMSEYVLSSFMLACACTLKPNMKHTQYAIASQKRNTSSQDERSTLLLNVSHMMQSISRPLHDDTAMSTCGCQGGYQQATTLGQSRRCAALDQEWVHVRSSRKLAQQPGSLSARHAAILRPLCPSILCLPIQALSG